MTTTALRVLVWTSQRRIDKRVACLGVRDSVCVALAAKTRRLTALASLAWPAAVHAAVAIGDIFLTRHCPARMV